MKTLVRSLLLMFLCMGIYSCTDDMVATSELHPDSVSDAELTEITIIQPAPFQDMDDASSRMEITDPTGSWNTVWSAGDTLGIFPDEGAQVEFKITNYGESSASFNGGGWGLKAGRTYAAYYPFSKVNYFRDKSNIVLDYTGQVQVGNGSAAHLGAYNFEAAKPTKSNGTSVSLALERLGSFMWLTLTVPASDTYTDLELVAEKGNSFVTKAKLSFTSTSYTLSALDYSSTIHLGLENVKLSAGGTLTAYIMLCGIERTITTPKVILHGLKGDYEGTLLKTNGAAGTIPIQGNARIPRKATLSDAYIKNASLIAAAEKGGGLGYAGVTFEKENGYVNVNNATNREALKKVYYISVLGKNDPSVCDEIGYFPNLKQLICENNNLVSLDVSKNPKLEFLNCGNNQLTSIDVSKNQLLSTLACGYNRISDIDVSLNQELMGLSCMNNNLTSLDVTHNRKLELLSCFGNTLGSLDVSRNVALEMLNVEICGIKSLDVSNCPALKDLKCDVNSLSSLDITNNTALEVLVCSYNSITSLDVSKNTKLKDLQCRDNKLTALDVSNNTLLETLKCGKNDITTLSAHTDNLTKLTTLDVSDCVNLKQLYCYYSMWDNPNNANKGALTTLNVSGCSALQSLNCAGNKITSLNLTTLSNLTGLECQGNLIRALDVSKNTKLKNLSCYANLLSALDITKCTSLKLFKTTSPVSEVFCGWQHTSASRDVERQLTLTITTSNSTTGNLPETTSRNKNVTVEYSTN